MKFVFTIQKPKNYQYRKLSRKLPQKFVCKLHAQFTVVTATDSHKKA